MTRADLSEQLAGAEQVQLKRRGSGTSHMDRLAHDPHARTWGSTMIVSRRSLLAFSLATAFAGLSGAAFAQAPREIRIDFATYNPVSLVLKEKGLLEKAFEKDGIAVRWVQTLG